MRLTLSPILSILLFLPVSMGSPGPAQAEAICPGTYTGWIVEDRWGAVHLANGVYRLALRGQAKAKALAWKDKPVRVEVTEVDRGGFLVAIVVGVKEIVPVEPALAGQLEIARTSR